MIDAERFDQLVAEAIDSLPDEFAQRLDNVGVVVDEEPTAEEIASTGVRVTLYGLYHGVPQTKRGHYDWAMPDKISIFRGPITRACGDDDAAVAALVRRVVIHEIAHHFGISDARLRELGAY